MRCHSKELPLGFLQIVEFIGLALAVRWVLVRARAADPPFTKQRWLFLLAMLGQGLTVVAIYFTLLGVESEVQPSRAVAAASFFVFLLAMVRLALLLFAFWLWIQIVRRELWRSRKVWFLVAAGVIAALVDNDAVHIVSFLVSMFVISRLKWTDEIHGWGRFGTLWAGVLVFILASLTASVQVDSGPLQNPSFGASSHFVFSPLYGELVGVADTWSRLTSPVGRAIGGLRLVLNAQLLILCIKMLVLPIRLRGLSLRRRFTLTYTLFRVIPGLLGVVAFLAAGYLAIGMHRTSEVRNEFHATAERNQFFARKVLAAGSVDAFEGMRQFVGDPDAVAVLRTVRIVPNDDVALGETVTVVPRDSVVIDTTLSAAASPGTDPRLIAKPFHDAGIAESVLGLRSVESALYIGGAVAERQGDTATVAEVYVPVNQSYLGAIARKIRCTVRVNLREGIVVGQANVSITGSASDSTVVLVAGEGDAAAGGGFYRHKRFLTRSFITVGNWLEPNDAEAAIELTLYTSLYDIVEGGPQDLFFIASNAVAILLFIGLLLIISAVEFTAARTGRGIMAGIVEDSKTLSEAARKFGEGDLSHRVEVRGEDELGRLASMFNRMAGNIQQHQAVLIEKERLEADLKLAREIQQRLLPQSPPVVPGLDVAGISIPSREVGGDLFYFLPAPDGRLGLTIGDVSGKSVPAALLMSTVLAALKTEVRLVPEEHEILTHLNRLIAEQVEPGRFVTFFYGVLDSESWKLRYACAGHNPPLLMRADGTPEWLREAGIPLGVLPEATYNPAEVQMHPGDVLVLYSDGVTEAESVLPEANVDETDGPAFFDEERLMTAVRDARTRGAAQIVETVVSAVNTFTGGRDLSDDLTLSIVKIRNGG